MDHEVFLVPSQFASIRDAVDAVRGPATIMIAPGVYAEDLDVVGKESVVIQSARFGSRGVTIAGGIAIERSAVWLSGIEIRSNFRAIGIVATEATISVQECLVAGNRGGVECRDSTVRLQKSMLAGNTGRAVSLVDCTAEIAGCSIQANAVYADDVARGAGIYAQRVQLRVWRSRVTDNSLFAPLCEGAGIYLADPVQVRIGGSVITGNGSGGGVFIRGEAARVAFVGDTVVRRNHPGDVITA